MKSFLYAFRGIAANIRAERNMRIHLCFAFYVIPAGLVTRITKTEWLAVLLCIGMVTASECMNTAIERLCNAVHPERSAGIRIAKDAAAGAVLCAAIVSAAVGCAVFLNIEKILLAYTFFAEHPVTFGFLILSFIPAIIFVRRRDK